MRLAAPINWTWEPLLVEIPAEDGAGGAITRTDTEYANPSVSRKPVTLNGQPGYHLEVTYTSTENSGEWIVRSGDIPGGATDSAAERQVSNLRWESKTGRWADYRLDAGGVTAHIDAYGDRTGPIARFSYDTEGRLSGIKDRADTQVLWYDYDAQGQLQFIRDAENHQVEYRYSDDRLSEVIDVRGHSWTYSYSNTDKLLTGITDPETRTTQIVYNNVKRVAKVILKDDQGNRLETRYVFEYDKTKKEYYVQIKDPTGSVSEFWYNSGSLLIRKSLNGVQTYAMSRDTGGAKESRIKSDRRGLKTRTDYDDWGNIIQTTYPDGSTTKASFKPTRILDRDPGENPTLDYQYTYDKTGNIKQKTTQNQTYDYAYDQLQRLTEAKSAAETEGWEYDPNGNRTSDNLNPGIWNYDINDRLKQSPVATYAYDEAGHTTSKMAGGVTTTYRYNAEGRLSRIEDGNQALIAEYKYDPLGRRYKKTTPNGTLYFHYSEEGLVGEFDASGTPVRQYGYVPDSTWTTNPLFQKTAQGYSYYRNDHLGTPQQVVAKNGEKRWGGVYRAFGELKSEAGSFDQKLRFPGQYFDEETGSYYNYFRDYDPTTGRYLQSDPTGLKGGLNVYTYVLNDPVALMDIYGLEITGKWIKAPHKGDINVTFGCDGRGCISLSAPELMLLNIQGKGTLTWKIECTETNDCAKDRTWQIDGELTFLAGRQVAVPIPLCMIMPTPKHKQACYAAVAAGLLIRIPAVKKEVIEDINDQVDFWLDKFLDAYDPNKICKAAS